MSDLWVLLLVPPIWAVMGLVAYLVFGPETVPGVDS